MLNIKRPWQRLYLVPYALFSFLTLMDFPFIHSDEPWLAGLSKAIIDQGSLFATEPFFDLLPRHPHAIKSLFHLLQAAALALFGWGPEAVRLLSLIAGLGVLWHFHAGLSRSLKNPWLPLAGLVLLSFNVQFLYASHFGRQEILLLLVLVLCWRLYESPGGNRSRKLWIPMAIGLAIGLHPNAFILAAMMGAFYLADREGRKALPNLVGITAAFAAAYAALSLAGNRTFIKDYWAYGATLGVDAAPLARLENFGAFFYKLYHQVAGTYYLPDLRFLLVLSALVVLAALALSPFLPRLRGPLLMVPAYLAALFIIGRYNPTSVLFLFFPVLVLLMLLMDAALPGFKGKGSATGLVLAAGILLAFQLATVHKELGRFDYGAYEAYIREIEKALPESPVVLGNLSSGFAFKDARFYDIRNLAFLGSEPDVDLASYIESRGINTLVYYEAYDYIHRNPQWQILYGDDAPYYEDLQRLLAEEAELVHRFESPAYGIRIVPYMDGYPWQVSVYHLDGD